MTTYDIAIVGATGVVGEALLKILHERKFPVGKLYALASERSEGKKVRFGDQEILVSEVDPFDFTKVQIAFFSAGAACSQVQVPRATAANCIVIDNTPSFRYEPDVPLVVPEVNPEAIKDYKNRYIIANPNCTTIQLVVALKPIYDRVGLSRINLVTFQSVSGIGREGIAELKEQTVQALNSEQLIPEVFPVPIAFNVIPQIDIFQENQYTKEEMKMVWETQKIFDNTQIMVNPTAVRVPTFVGHAEAVHIETERHMSLEEVRACLVDAPGVALMDDNLYPTPVTQGTHTDEVYVGRVRADISHPNGINLWIVSDNIRKGAALNAIQIAEVLIKDYL